MEKIEDYKKEIFKAKERLKDDFEKAAHEIKDLEKKIADARRNVQYYKDKLHRQEEEEEKQSDRNKQKEDAARRSLKSAQNFSNDCKRKVDNLQHQIYDSERRIGRLNRDVRDAWCWDIPGILKKIEWEWTRKTALQALHFTAKAASSAADYAVTLAEDVYAAAKKSATKIGSLATRRLLEAAKVALTVAELRQSSIYQMFRTRM